MNNKDRQEVREMFRELATASNEELLNKIQSMISQPESTTEPTTKATKATPSNDSRQPVELFSKEQIDQVLMSIVSHGQGKQGWVNTVLRSHGEKRIEPFTWDLAFQLYYIGRPLSDKQRDAALQALNRKKYEPLAKALNDNPEPASAA